jgi:phosphoribosylamine--glycine ligase
MGAYAPSAGIDSAMQTRVMSDIVMPVLEGMRSEGSEFRGFLFVGLMLTADGPKVIEFNARLGDPETQVVLPGIKEDLSTLCLAAASGELSARALTLSREPRVCVVMASGGYPESYETGKIIHGLDSVTGLPDVHVFHSGTARRGQDVVTAGGRVLSVVASGAEYREAIDRAYGAVRQISFEGMHYRKDIGARALQ